MGRGEWPRCPISPRCLSSRGDGPSQASAISSNGVVAGWSNVLKRQHPGAGRGYLDATPARDGSPTTLASPAAPNIPIPAVAFAATAVNSAGTAVGWGYLGGEEPTGTAPLNAVEFSGGKTILLGGLGADYPYNGAA